MPSTASGRPSSAALMSPHRPKSLSAGSWWPSGCGSQTHEAPFTVTTHMRSAGVNARPAGPSAANQQRAPPTQRHQRVTATRRRPRASAHNLLALHQTTRDARTVAVDRQQRGGSDGSGDDGGGGGGGRDSSRCLCRGGRRSACANVRSVGLPHERQRAQQRLERRIRRLHLLDRPAVARRRRTAPLVNDGRDRQTCRLAAPARRAKCRGSRSATTDE
jgi:hypothetical protein